MKKQSSTTNLVKKEEKNTRIFYLPKVGARKTLRNYHELYPKAVFFIMSPHLDKFC